MAPGRVHRSGGQGGSACEAKAAAVSGSDKSHIGTLVERSSRFVQLVKLENKTTECVIAALTAAVQQLPEQLKQSLTWDRDLERAKHKQFTVETGVRVYFCGPKSPWQRGTNENTAGVQRATTPVPATRYEPQSRHQQQLDDIAHHLNSRPRKTLNFMTSSRKLSGPLE